MPIQPIEKIHVAEAVFEQLKMLILNGEWKSGQKLPSENEMKDLFGVSRVSIRESLERLKSLGLVETRHGSGSYIREFNQEPPFTSIFPIFLSGDKDVIEILELRSAIECAAAPLACMNMTPGDIEKLRKIAQKMEIAARDTGEAARYDLEFHLLIVKLSGNRYFYQVEQILKDILSTNFVKVINALGTDAAFPYHNKILSAFEARESDNAYLYMKKHIDQVIDSIKRKKGI
jgi:GntR family transcriptional repressor for pyruvate dehydrogenase complex